MATTTITATNRVKCEITSSLLWCNLFLSKCHQDGEKETVIKKSLVHQQTTPGLKIAPIHIIVITVRGNWTQPCS